MDKKFNPSKIQCNNCKDIIQSSYPGEWVACKCFENKKDNKGCYIDSTRSYERMAGIFTYITSSGNNIDSKLLEDGL